MKKTPGLPFQADPENECVSRSIMRVAEAYETDPNPWEDVLYMPYGALWLCFLYALCKSIVDGFRRKQPNAAVMMLRVIPGKEDPAEATAILDGAESIGELRPVLERLELRF